MKRCVVLLVLLVFDIEAQPRFSSLCGLDLFNTAVALQALNLGADPNEACEGGTKAVAQPMSLEVFAMLVRYGADIPPSLASGWLSNIVHLEATSSQSKSQIDRFRLAEYLIQKGGRFRSDELVRDRLTIEQQWVRLCLENGADPNAHFGNGWTPLFAAANAGNYEAAELLLKAGANPNQQREIFEGRKQSILSYVSQSDRWVALLRQYGAKE